MKNQLKLNKLIFFIVFLSFKNIYCQVDTTIYKFDFKNVLYSKEIIKNKVQAFIIYYDSAGNEMLDICKHYTSLGVKIDLDIASNIRNLLKRSHDSHKIVFSFIIQENKISNVRILENDLENYSYNELNIIIKKALKNISFNIESCPSIIEFTYIEYVETPIYRRKKNQGYSIDTTKILKE